MRFLVIDDSIPMQRIITNILARLGHRDVVVAANGREALKHIERGQIDFVITDWYMPEMAGIDVLRNLRAKDATRHVPILMVTANGARDDVTRAAQLRVDGYVLKPFTAETLKSRIEALLATALPPADDDDVVATEARTAGGR